MFVVYRGPRIQSEYKYGGVRTSSFVVYTFRLLNIFIFSFFSPWVDESPKLFWGSKTWNFEASLRQEQPKTWWIPTFLQKQCSIPLQFPLLSLLTGDVKLNPGIESEIESEIESHDAKTKRQLQLRRNIQIAHSVKCSTIRNREHHIQTEDPVLKTEYDIFTIQTRIMKLKYLAKCLSPWKFK